MNASVIFASLAGLTSIVIAFIGVWMSRRKVSADATKVLTEIALSLIDPLKEEVDGLKKVIQDQQTQIDALKCENELLHRWSQLLFSQVVESGSDPISFGQVQKLMDK